MMMIVIMTTTLLLLLIALKLDTLLAPRDGGGDGRGDYVDADDRRV